LFLGGFAVVEMENKYIFDGTTICLIFARKMSASNSPSCSTAPVTASRTFSEICLLRYPEKIGEIEPP